MSYWLNVITKAHTDTLTHWHTHTHRKRKREIGFRWQWLKIIDSSLTGNISGKYHVNRNSQFSSWFPLIYREFMIPALRIRIRPQYCNVLLYWIVVRFDENSRIDVHITVQCKFQSTWKSFISGPFFFNISMWSLGLPFFLFYYDISQLVIVSIGYLMFPPPSLPGSLFLLCCQKNEFRIVASTILKSISSNHITISVNI